MKGRKKLHTNISEWGGGEKSSGGERIEECKNKAIGRERRNGGEQTGKKNSVRMEGG